MTSSATSGAIQRNLRLGRPPRPPSLFLRSRRARPEPRPDRPLLVLGVALVAEAGDEPVAAVAVLLLVLATQAAPATRVAARLGVRTGLAVLVPAAVLAGLPVLAAVAVLAVAVLAAVAVLVLRAELARIVAGLRGLAGIRRNIFGAGRPLGPCPGRVLGATRVQRPGLAVPGLVVHRLVSGRQRREVLIRAPGVRTGQPR